MRTYIGVLLAALISLSCDQGTRPEYPAPESLSGSVAFSIAKVSVPPEVRLLAVRLERQGFQTISDSVVVAGTVDTIKIRMSNIPAGSWNVTVDARDASGVTRYSGKGTVTVTDGQLSQMYVYMTATSGGEVQITVVWGGSPLKWKMSAANPVLVETPGTWDQDHYYFDDPNILKINGVYHMWYASGYNISINKAETLWIAHAASLDGIHWTKTGPIFAPGAAGSWRDKGAVSPCVIYEGGVYKMWFVGFKNPLQYQNGIGYATSLDGTNWSVNSSPIIPLSSTIGATYHPAVVKKDNTYYMFIGVSTSNTIYPPDVVLMTSTDGLTWQNKGAVLSARKDVSWQHSGIIPCEVIYDENRFKMFFTGMDTQSFSVGYAESVDGTTWTGSIDAPTLTSANTVPWVTTSVGFPAVLREDGKLKMWFSAIVTNPPRYQIGYAEQVQ